HHPPEQQTAQPHWNRARLHRKPGAGQRCATLLTTGRSTGPATEMAGRQQGVHMLSVILLALTAAQAPPPQRPPRPPPSLPRSLQPRPPPRKVRPRPHPRPRLRRRTLGPRARPARTTVLG